MSEEKLSLNSNISTTWDGKTGETVQSYIKEQFDTIISKVQTSVQEISVESDKLDTTKFTFKATKENGEEYAQEITVIPASTKDIILQKFTVPEYVLPGEALNIGYGYTVEEDGVRLAVSGTKANITINGTTIPFSLAQSYTSSSTYRQGTLQIDSSYLIQGLNTLSIILTYTDGKGSASFSAADEVPISAECASFNITFTCSDDDAYKNYIENSTSEIAYTFGVLDRKSSLNQYKSIISSIAIKAITSQGNTTVYTYIPSSSTIPSTFTGEECKTTLQRLGIISGSYQAPVGFYAQVTLSDSTIINSNVIKYSYIYKKYIESGNSINVTTYAYKLPDFEGNPNSDISINNLSFTQYDTFNISMFANAASNIAIEYKLDSTVLKTLELTTSDLTSLTNISWSNYVFQNTGSYVISIGGTTFNCTVEALGGPLAVPGNPILSLNSNGKSGKDSTWEYGNYSTTFTGFDWEANGWLNNALVVNNNATAYINCTPFNTSGAKSITVRFQTINENSTDPIIDCYKLGYDGFRIYPQKAVLYQGGDSIATQFTSEATFSNKSVTTNNVKEITFVWYGDTYNNSCAIYVNGVSQIFETYDNYGTHSKGITITSDSTSTYIYNIDIYNKALSFSEVQALNKAHEGIDLTSYIKANAIFSEDISVGNNTKKVTIDSLPVDSLYMLIKPFKNELVTGQNKPWEVIDKLKPTAIVANETVETKNWTILCGNTYLIRKTADGSGSPCNFFADRIALSGQGTSSMDYCLKNFRIYFKQPITNPEETSGYGFGDGYSLAANGEYSYTTLFKTGSEVTLNNIPTEGDKDIAYSLYSTTYKDSNDIHDTYTSIPVNMFCLKADYAESSGVHNTGFARMANYALENAAAIDSTNTYTEATYKLPQNTGGDTTVRSTIDGRPIYLFFAYKDEKNEEQTVYHGKYNINNDKATGEVFGFSPKGNSSYWKEAGEHATKLATLFGSTYNDLHSTFTIDGTNYVNPTECWEFSTNDASKLEHKSLFETTETMRQLGAFTFPYTYDAINGKALTDMPTYSNINYRTLDPFNERLYNDSSKLAWFDTEQAWEMRYPDGSQGKKIKKKYKIINESTNLPTYQPFLLKSVYRFLHKYNIYLYQDTSKNSIAQTFAKNLKYFFNVDYLVKYYVLTKWFICADQRIKNGMLAFYYDPNAKEILGTDSGATLNCPMGKMRGYYIFYDNDTILGVNNTGDLTNSWNSDEIYGIFQGIDSNNVCFHAIWGNLEYCYKSYIDGTYGENVAIKSLGKLVEVAYTTLRSKLSNTTIYEFMNSKLPDAAQNIDFEVKYAYPSTLLENTDSDWENLSKYQGDRKYHREWLISKRSLWFDDIYGGPSINDYAIRFKPTEASIALAGHTIKVTTAIDNWKFYVREDDYATPEAIKSLNIGDEIGIIDIGTSIINSNVTGIVGLYGVKSLNFSLYGNTQNLSPQSPYGVCPFLTNYTIGNSDGILYINGSEITSLVTSSFAPNLEYIELINIQDKGASESSTVGLSNYSKLKSIILSNTAYSVILPIGERLEILKLYKPSSLIINNKPNLTTFTVEDPSNLNRFDISGCSSLVYNKVLTWLTSKQNNEYLDATLVIGTEDSPETFTSSQLDTLCSLSSIPVERLSISGYIIYPDINNYTYNGQSGITLLQERYTNLTIIEDDTQELIISTYGVTNISEGESITFVSSKDIKTWSFTLNGKGSNLCTITSSKPRQYTLTFNKSNSFDEEKNYNLVVTGESTSGKTANSDTIILKQTKISSISLTTESKSYIFASTILLNVSLDTLTTKKYLFNKTNVENGTIVFTAKVGENSSGTLSYTYDDNEILKSITYTKASENTQDIIVSCISPLKTSVTLIVDTVLTTKTAIDSDTSLAWIPYLFSTEYSTQADSLTKSAFYSRRITDTLLSSIAASITGDTSTESTVQDLNLLQYCKAGTSSITMPNMRISNLSIPEGIQSFTWKSLYSNNGDYVDYGVITFPTTLTQALVRLTYSSALNNLHFNISKCNNITKIRNSGDSLVANEFNLYLATSNASAKTNNLLFTSTGYTYPTSLIELGNYSTTIGSSNAQPATIFNYIKGAGTPVTSPLFSLGYVGHPVYIGCLANYSMDYPCITWGEQCQYVKGLYYTFNGNSGLPTEGTLEFSTIENIGDCAFNNCSNLYGKNILIGNNVSTLGYSSFGSCKASIGSTTVNTLDLQKVTVFPTEVFNNCGAASNHTFTLGTKVLSIGSNSFNNTDTSRKFNIYLNNVPSTLQSTSFGTYEDTTIIHTTSEIASKLSSIINNNISIVVE